MFKLERIPPTVSRSDTGRTRQRWSVHAAVAALFLVFASGLWSAPATAGANGWTWWGYPSTNPGCDRTGINDVKDCWVSYVGVTAQTTPCPAVVGGITNITQDYTGHWWADVWAQILFTDIPNNGVVDCWGAPSTYHLQVDFTDVCPAPAELDIMATGCTKKQRQDAIGNLCKANPCEVLSGNKRERQVDYAPGTGVLAFERTYNSVDYHPAKPGSPLGRSWFASYLQYLASDPDTANGLDAAYVNAVRPNGDVIRFNSTSPGSTSTQFQAVGEIKIALCLR
jgi:hypothetical protein